ncbi:hypothetical protein COT75_02240 [Candidatus Beckwithbacteria bacterium CG10_big_fil_rev_8_21_14_0_10_34_10]|uniref:Uncharacterized protein n=1 Tax=Candidatus Beckwithbacteria bacterium CG10_big_fil_rev_8_21_14_0_10_34_10 TaxID=1974495 RepID=A0A2H0W9G9_9BACT|nr:MAG: hypothetical protein COT75_02240 [Candidatus Beckwithbacteria bacterium CG10_big_fil_rev_8_21_14_0_10_34_10]
MKKIFKIVSLILILIIFSSFLITDLYLSTNPSNGLIRYAYSDENQDNQQDEVPPPDVPPSAPPGSDDKQSPKPKSSPSPGTSPSPSPSAPPSETSSCFQLSFYLDGVKVSPDEIRAEEVYLIGAWGEEVDMARFKINNSDWVTTPSDNYKSDTAEYYIFHSFDEESDNVVIAQIHAYGQWWDGSNCEAEFYVPSKDQGLLCSNLSRSPSDNLILGDEVVFTCSYEAKDVDFHHYDYRINISHQSWEYPDNWQNIAGSTPAYRIEKTGDYQIECRTCSSENESNCTHWGQAGGWNP